MVPVMAVTPSFTANRERSTESSCSAVSSSACSIGDSFSMRLVRFCSRESFFGRGKRRGRVDGGKCSAVVSVVCSSENLVTAVDDDGLSARVEVSLDMIGESFTSVLAVMGELEREGISEEKINGNNDADDADGDSSPSPARATVNNRK